MVIVHDNKKEKTTKVIIEGLSKQFNNCIIVRCSDTYAIEDAETKEYLVTLPVNITVIFHVQ